MLKIILIAALIMYSLQAIIMFLVFLPIAYEESECPKTTAIVASILWPITLILNCFKK